MDEVAKSDVPQQHQQTLRRAMQGYVTGAPQRLAKRGDDRFKPPSMKTEEGKRDRVAMREATTLAKDMYQGLGGLGDKTDLIEWQEGDKTQTQEAVIVELRSISGMKGVDGWVSWMKDVYSVADEAIKASRPKGFGRRPPTRASSRSIEQNLVREADELRQAFEQLAHQLNEDELTLGAAQGMAGRLAGDDVEDTVPQLETIGN